MSIRSASVWRAVLWPKPWVAMPLRHLESNVDHARSRKNGWQGETIWAGSTASGQVGLAWRWLEVQPGVIALTDPTNIVSNLMVVGDDGDVLESRRVLMLNTLVHSLHWQYQVRKLLREQQSQAMASRRTAITTMAAHA